MQRSIPPSGNLGVMVLGIIMIGRGDLGLVVPVMASGCLGTRVLLQFHWVMIYMSGGIIFWREKARVYFKLTGRCKFLERI